MGGIRRIAVGLFALFLAVPQPAARAALPADLSARVAAAARESAAAVERDAAIAGTVADRALADTMMRRARERAARAMAAATVALIAEHPAHAADIVAAAAAAAPQARPTIVAAAGQAFPGFAGTVGAAPAAAASPTAFAPAPPPPEPAGPAPPAEPEPPSDVVADEPETFAGGVKDPLEGLNRAVFFVNDQFDTYILRPLAWTYGAVAPEVLKQALRNAFDNLGAPVRLANDLLQLELEDAAVTTGRFVVNSTVGIAGMIDVAEDFGLEEHPADFGQTLHVWGVGPGPYLVLPLFGPSTARDAVGLGVDTFFDPLTYLLDFETNLMIAGGEGVVRREAVLDELDDLRATSLDYYAALRSFYLQNRAVELNRGELVVQEAVVDDLFADFE